jgi:hypothetical protein
MRRCRNCIAACNGLYGSLCEDCWVHSFSPFSGESVSIIPGLGGVSGGWAGPVDVDANGSWANTVRALEEV